MGLLDFLLDLFTGGTRQQCPACGTADARRNRAGQIRCKNPVCQYFDPRIAPRGAGTVIPTRGSFHPAHPLTIRYKNFAGQDREFIFELNLVFRQKNHFVGTVAPTGRRISLSRDRIQNLSEVESQLPASVVSQSGPTPRENQILAYHKKHGTTSPLFEKIRAKYPD